jgi:CRISPR-associated endonuclease/helicase Cas3
MNTVDFFAHNYKALRSDYTPMKWMRRMFLRLIDGQAPSVVDLPTGAGKTELIVIWLIALAWYAKQKRTAKAVPRSAAEVDLGCKPAGARATSF